MHQIVIAYGTQCKMLLSSPDPTGLQCRLRGRNMTDLTYNIHELRVILLWPAL